MCHSALDPESLNDEAAWVADAPGVVDRLCFALVVWRPRRQTDRLTLLAYAGAGISSRSDADGILSRTLQAAFDALTLVIAQYAKTEIKL